MKRILTIIFTFFLTFSAYGQSKAKYVFYFIGDGMGMAHVNLTEAYLSALENQIGTKKLTMTKFPVFGMATTFAENRYITGSAASGTALASGVKTSINTIGLKSNHKTNLLSIAHFAKKNGQKVGILSSVGINHATPAAFYAHQPKRNQYYQIALQLSKSNFDLFAGGGFIAPRGKKGNQKDVYEITKNNDYTVYKDIEAIKNLKKLSQNVMLVSPETKSEAELPYVLDQSDNFFTLADFTKKSIELLDNENGFFMMIEGGKIDWAAHSNDASAMVYEVIDFDNAIKVAYDFYLKHPDETLIVITADHETGGLGIGCNKMKYKTNFELLKKQKNSIDVASEKLTELLAQKNFNFEKYLDFGKNYFGLEKSDLSKKDTKFLKNIFEKNYSKSLSKTDLPKNAEKMARALMLLHNQRAGVCWTTRKHTGTPVPVISIGVGSAQFDGYFDNTEIPKKIAEAMKIELKN